jgi:DNA-directed RNA polymerase subunit E'/Rpb7
MVYTPSVLTRRVALPVSRVDSKIKTTLETILSKELDGRCTVEGFIRPGKRSSIRVLEYSCGLLKQDSVHITVVFECDIAFPFVGDVLECVVENKTHAGLKCRMDGEASPYVIFVARDHHHTLGRFAAINEGDSINVTIVGQRFDVNDKFISIIATLADAYTGPADDALFSGTIEYGDPTLDVMKSHPEKTFVLTKPPKNARSNAIVLPSTFSDASYASNQKRIDADVERMQEASILVFPTEGIDESLRDTAPKTYAYLMQRLSALGMTQQTREESRASSESEEEEEEEDDEDV